MRSSFLLYSVLARIPSEVDYPRAKFSGCISLIIIAIGWFQCELTHNLALFMLGYIVGMSLKVSPNQNISCAMTP